MNYVIGIDSSTTATKAQLVDASGGVVAAVSSEYSYETPQPLWSEQDPELWWTATQEAISGVLAKARVKGDEVAAIGLTGQMHGLVLLDTDDHSGTYVIVLNLDQGHAKFCVPNGSSAGTVVGMAGLKMEV